MSVLIFRLNDAPEDEAQDVRELLSEHGFEYHETGSGFIGLQVAGLWLLDESQKDAARAVIDDYQRERSARMRAEYDALRASDEIETFGDRARRHPLLVVFYLGAAAAVLYIVLSPFLSLG